MFSGNHISIEGMDGVGKSTTCKLLSERIGYEFIDKPLRFLFEDSGDYSTYLRIRDYVNNRSDRVFTSWFYGLGSTFLYDRYAEKNIITDRHILSNYAWSGERESEPVFRTLLDTLGTPNYTFILYADPDIIRERLTSRSAKDSDLAKIKVSDHIYQKMESFLSENGMPGVKIDTSGKTPSEVCDQMITILAEEGIL